MSKLSPKFLTEIAEIQGKGKGAMSDWLNFHQLRIIQDCSDFTEEEAMSWQIGPSYSPYNKSKVQDIYEHECLMERIDLDLYFCKLHDFHDKVAQALIQISQKKKEKSHAGHDLGPREFTLTYSPDWFDDEKAQMLMKQAIDRLCSYYETEIVYLKAVGEKTKAGRVHIHCYYELERGLKITDKNMKRAYHKWNSHHHHHKLVKSTSDFLGYIDKDAPTAWYTKVVDNRHGGGGRFFV